MHLSEELMIQYNAERVHFRKNNVIFEQGSYPRWYYQVENGLVIVSRFDENHEEFIQRVFRPGESFGEPPLLGDFPYPSTATPKTEVIVWRIPKPYFVKLLRENFDAHMRLTTLLSKRLSYKSKLIADLGLHSGDKRILNIIKFHCAATPSKEDPVLFPFTRQELSGMTGLRVETVIRVVKDLEKQGKLIIRDHKIYLPRSTLSDQALP